MEEARIPDLHQFFARQGVFIGSESIRQAMTRLKRRGFASKTKRASGYWWRLVNKKPGLNTNKRRGLGA